MQTFDFRKSGATRIFGGTIKRPGEILNAINTRSLKTVFGAKAALAACCVMLFALTMIGLTVSGLRMDAIENATDDVHNIATVLAQQTSRSVEAVDVLLSDLQGRLRIDDNGDEEFTRRFAGKDTYEYLSERLARLSKTDVITITNAEGKVINLTRSWPPPPIDLSDREFFKLFQNSASDALNISPPIISKVTGRPVIYFAKRLSNLQGQFRGIALVGLEPTYFRDVYESIKSLPYQTFELRNSSGNILANYSNGTAGHGGAAAAQITAMRNVGNFPLTLHVSVTEDAALAGWRSRARLIIFGTLTVTVLLFLVLVAFRRQSRELQDTNSRMDLAMNNMSQGLCFFDSLQRLILCNEQYLRLYSISRNDITLGMTLSDIFDLRLNAGSGPKMARSDYLPWRDSIRNLTVPSDSIVELQNGRVVKIWHQPLAEGGWVATHEDITSSHRNQARLTYLAHHDVLTGLANRQGLKEKIELEGSAWGSAKAPFAVLMLDLDRFKTINDTLGHSGGDNLLRQVARRIQREVPPNTEIARFGGDEFAMLLRLSGGDRPVNQHSVAAIAARICEAVNEPFEIGPDKVAVAASIGIAFADKEFTDADDVLIEADVALYTAKKQGGNSFAFFDVKMAERVYERTKLEKDMRAGLERGEFELHYQVYVDVATRTAAGMEALVRWRHPEYGVIEPLRFIPIAESSGFIMQLGEWILRQACEDAASLAIPMKVAVNVSGVQFRNGRLLPVITTALRRSGLPPELLEVEVTESVLLDKDPGYLETLNQLSSIGVTIALDDFGTGYSSFGYLKQFAFDKLKIDRSFIDDITTPGTSLPIISAVIGLARGLQIATTAEGVETEQQFDMVRAGGVTYAQGYLFGKPLPIASFRNGHFETGPRRDALRA